MSRYHYLIILLLIAFGFTGAFLSGYFLRMYMENQCYEFAILNQAYRILIDHAYNELPEETSMEYGMIRGLLQASGDPYAVFLEPVQHELEINSLEGGFGGIGVELTRLQGGNVIIYPIVNGPADRAGILNGDRLLSVEELQITADTTIDEIHAAIRGRIGEKVKIVVIRESCTSSIELLIKRELIHLPSITWHRDLDYHGVGILNVNVISESTPEEIQNAVSELKENGVTHFVLDLRDNGGGLLSAGVDTARLFLKDGKVIQQHYRGKEVETFHVKRPGPLQDIPLIILVNHATASAAEIIAGSLQSQNRAFLVGEPTFGKNTIQLVFDLEDKSSLHLTAAKWWIPDSTPLFGEHGLQPDISVSPEDSNADVILITAIQSLINQ
jgi:carboxyl-terminal processing protease